jgi:fermentation-respiration switch protein FrsA (DUF1100 family)
MKTNVTFDSTGLKIAGHLYTPDDGVSGPRPAIVVGHPGSGVKEQAAGLYAQRLAEQGFVTVAFDAAYQGESEGEPRDFEDPAHRVEDLKAAVSFFTMLDEVNTDQIGALGISASGGYALTATATDRCIKAVATVSAVDIARQFRHGADGAQDPAVFQAMLDAAAAARTAEARGQGVQTFQIFPDTAEEARARGQHVFEGFEYYCTHQMRLGLLRQRRVGRTWPAGASSPSTSSTQPPLKVRRWPRFSRYSPSWSAATSASARRQPWP